MSEQPAGAALPAQKASTQTAASSEGTDTPTRPIPSPGHTEKIETNDSGTSPAIPLSDLEAAAPAAASASAGSPAAGTSAVTANAAASSEDAVAQRRKITCLADVTPLRPPFYGFTPQDWALWLNAEASSLTGTGASASWTSNVTKFSKAFDSGLLASLPSIYSDLDEALQREIMSAIQLLPAASIAKHQEALRALAHHSRSLADSSATHGQQARSAPDLNELRASMLLASSPTQFDASVAAMARSMLPSASTLGDNDSSTIAEAAAREAGEKHERDPAPSPAMLPEDLVGLDSLSINPTVPHLHQHQKRIDAHIRDGAVCGFAEEVEKLDGNADGLSRQEKSDSMETRNKAVSAALDLAAIRDILAMNPEDKEVPFVDPGFSGFGDNALRTEYPEAVFKQIEDFLSNPNPRKPRFSETQVRIVLHRQWLLDYRTPSLKPAFQIEIAITLDYNELRWRLTKLRRRIDYHKEHRLTSIEYGRRPLPENDGDDDGVDDASEKSADATVKKDLSPRADDGQMAAAAPQKSVSTDTPSAQPSSATTNTAAGEFGGVDTDHARAPSPVAPRARKISRKIDSDSDDDSNDEAANELPSAASAESVPEPPAMPKANSESTSVSVANSNLSLGPAVRPSMKATFGVATKKKRVAIDDDDDSDEDNDSESGARLDRASEQASIANVGATTDASADESLELAKNAKVGAGVDTGADRSPEQASAANVDPDPSANRSTESANTAAAGPAVAPSNATMPAKPPLKLTFGLGKKKKRVAIDDDDDSDEENGSESGARSDTTSEPNIANVGAATASLELAKNAKVGAGVDTGADKSPEQASATNVDPSANRSIESANAAAAGPAVVSSNATMPARPPLKLTFGMGKKKKRVAIDDDDDSEEDSDSNAGTVADKSNETALPANGSAGAAQSPEHPNSADTGAGAAEASEKASTSAVTHAAPGVAASESGMGQGQDSLPQPDHPPTPDGS